MFCYIVTPDCTGSTQHACGLQAKFYQSVNAAVPTKQMLNKPGKGSGKSGKDDRHPQIRMYRNHHSEPPGLSEQVLYRFWLNL